MWIWQTAFPVLVCYLGKVTITKIRSDKNHVVFNKSRHRLESRYVTGQLTLGHWTWYALANKVFFVYEPWDETDYWVTWQGYMHLSRRSWVRTPQLYFYFVLRFEDRLLCTSEVQMPRYIVEYITNFFLWYVRWDESLESGKLTESPPYCCVTAASFESASFCRF